ncbi:class I SAM-dependent methyltransferase [Roseitranquillus sediminis]|uniref:class I SAM-dependent methyltransferase n=1 Tax=Roseitranquillus sediminis TaxID=2809051 RepID=UPI001D0CA11B|nr:SAM-dependent methyltransferase [Roseitranquillus sediminis]MBM9594445.1 SAM-dependent methyltransferase [Roseitranquillus sediminis]
MTELGQLIAARISRTGPITVADFMADCLMHPTLGYYTTRDPFGAAGDFVTAPEISQMFGELLGLALAQCWLDAGRPSAFALVELGPGRGTLMADLLRATLGVPGFHEAARLHLIEGSPALRERQAECLRAHGPCWHASFDDVPDLPLFLVANEFFDALPIRQFVRDERGWRERMVAIEGSQLTFALGQPAAFAALDHRLADTAENEFVETCAPAQGIAASIAGRIARQGGAALLIDYGGWRSRGETLQALRAHRPEPPLASPGEADLTAHVDFEAIADAARVAGAATTPMMTQGVLLERLGITPRAQALARGLGGEAMRQHVAAHRRLTHPDEMGSLVKAMAIHNGTPPPGFEL